MHLALLKGLVTQSAMSAFVTRAVVGAADSEEGPTPEELPQPMELGLGYVRSVAQGTLLRTTSVPSYGTGKLTRKS